MFLVVVMVRAGDRVMIAMRQVDILFQYIVMVFYNFINPKFPQCFEVRM